MFRAAFASALAIFLSVAGCGNADTLLVPPDLSPGVDLGGPEHGDLRSPAIADMSVDGTVEIGDMAHPDDLSLDDLSLDDLRALPDEAQPRDLAASPDLSMPDLSMPDLSVIVISSSPDLSVSLDQSAPAQMDLAISFEDLSVAEDFALSPDLSSPTDLASPIDLAVSRDLAPPTDLTASLDLASPTDLAVPRDLAIPPDLCSGVALPQHFGAGNVVVLFDQSNSMKSVFPNPAGGDYGPKWQVAEHAVLTGLVSGQAILNVGAIFFPTTATGNTCSTVADIGTAPQIPLEPPTLFNTDFQSHFSAPAWTTILGQPMVDAMNKAVLALPDPSTVIGPRAVVLIGDGARTCDTVLADLLAPAMAMSARGIKTYVVALPGSASTLSALDALAQAGGTSTAAVPADPTAFAAALAQVAADTIDPCTIVLNTPPADPTQLHLVATDAANPGGYTIPPGAGGDAGGDGWSLSTDRAVTLTGSVCTRQTSGSYTSLQLIYGCSP